MPALTSPTAHTGDHVVQFYATEADLLAGAGGYLRDGALAGEATIVIATEAHRRAFEAHLAAAGLDVAAARAEGALVVLDVDATLARFMRDGGVDREAFFEVVGGVVRSAAATGRAVRAYGEMVALLWEAGDVPAAIELETLWNELGTELPFSLYCAYRSDSVAGHEHAGALHEVCRLHTAVMPAVPVEATWQFAPDVGSPAEARDVAAHALAHAGVHHDVVEAARIVVSELAANAVVHAGSPFSISLLSEDSRLRILVQDRSEAMPEVPEASDTRLSGRGLRLIDMLARDWGAHLVPGGKVVWAELGRP